jgi:hypothetical protein
MAVIYTLSPGMKRKINRLLLKKKGVRGAQLCYKLTAAPSTNTDIAMKNGDICVRLDNGYVYVASSVGASTTTWTNIA